MAHTPDPDSGGLFLDGHAHSDIWRPGRRHRPSGTTAVVGSASSVSIVASMMCVALSQLVRVTAAHEIGAQDQQQRQGEDTVGTVVEHTWARGRQLLGVDDDELADSRIAWIVFGFMLLGLIALIIGGMVFLMIAIKGQIERIKWKRLPSKFSQENGYSYDVVLVMPIYPADQHLSKWQQKYSHQFIVQSLNDAGLETEMFYSAQQDELYIKIRADLDRLKRQADKTDYKMELDPLAVSERLAKGKKDASGNWMWLPMSIVDEEHQCRFDPHEYIYGKFCIEDDMQDVFHNRALPQGTIFRGVDRIKLIMSILEAPVSEHGCDLPLRKLKMKKVLKGYFPLHDFDELAQLRNTWLRVFQRPNRQPFTQIRNYFGEKIAMYFGWLGIYTNWLAYASFAGVVTWLIIVGRGDGVNSNAVIGFAAFMAIWSTLYLEKWKQKQVRYAMQWGMIGYEEEEQDRVEFFGSTIISPVDSKSFTYFPERRRLSFYAKSQMIICSAVILIIGVVAGIITMNSFISGKRDDGQGTSVKILGYEIGSILVFFLNAVFIHIGGELFNGLARRLTDNENHRTDTIYEDSLIFKSFVFNFINSYTSLFYIAFLARAFHQECNGSDNHCMEGLNTALGTIFCTRLLISNVFEVGIPAFVYYKNTQENKLSREGAESLKASYESITGSPLADERHADRFFEIGAVEEQFMLDEYTATEDLFGDYLEMVLQFGYSSLFSTSFTLAPLLALVNNYVEIRVDAWKVSCQSRRPFPSGAEDIGMWENLLGVLSILQVTTNTAIICFTSNLSAVKGVPMTHRVLFFLLVEHFAIMVKIGIGMVISEIPEEIQIQIDRAKAITKKIIDNEVDEESEIHEYLGTVDQDDAPAFADYTVYAGDNEWINREMTNRLLA